MDFEKFLSVVLPKIGPNAAFDAARDTELKALRKLLIDKGIINQHEIQNEIKSQLAEMAKTIERMPPLPKS